jgi:hypothetical protein
MAEAHQGSSAITDEVRELFSNQLSEPVEPRHGRVRQGRLRAQARRVSPHVQVRQVSLRARVRRVSPRGQVRRVLRRVREPVPSRVQVSAVAAPLQVRVLALLPVQLEVRQPARLRPPAPEPRLMQAKTANPEA